MAEKSGMDNLHKASSFITFSSQGVAPSQYTVHLSCKGLVRIDKSLPLIVSEQHEFDILLDNDFPHVAPRIIWKTPIFHPNIAYPHICLGDYWYPAWTISQMCIAICEMVQYKTFNIYDPLNKECALWLHDALQQQPDLFPVDNRPVIDLDFDIFTPDSVHYTG